MGIAESVSNTIPHIPPLGWAALVGGGAAVYLVRRSHMQAAAPAPDPNDGYVTPGAPGPAPETQGDVIHAAGDVQHQSAMDQIAEAKNLKEQFAEIFTGGFMPGSFTISTPSGYDINVDNASGYWGNQNAQVAAQAADYAAWAQAYTSTYNQFAQSYTSNLGLWFGYLTAIKDGSWKGTGTTTDTAYVNPGDPQPPVINPGDPRYSGNTILPAARNAAIAQNACPPGDASCIRYSCAPNDMECASAHGWQGAMNPWG